ncbi:MAG: glycosyltransferase family 1 protein [Casimicrobiaceae bacterium]
MSVPARTIYVECTSTYRFDSLTGISRVIHNVMRHLPALAAAQGFAVVPVWFAEGAFHRVPVDASGCLQPRSRDRGDDQMRSGGRQRLDRLATLVPAGRLRDALLAHSDEPGVANLLRRAARAAQRLRLWRVGAVEMRDAVTIGSADVLLRVDLTLVPDMRAALVKLRAQHTAVCAIIYDLIPLLHPEFWPPTFVEQFRAWTATVFATSDHIFTISRTVKADLETYRGSLPTGSHPAAQSIDWFHLGYDMHGDSGDAQPRATLRAVFESGRPVLLNVGWFDPRKNQVRLVEAVGRLWARGVHATLLIIGKRGTGAEDVLAGIRRQPGSERFVRMFHDLTDAEVLYAMKHARALVYASYVEGFGLPLVEALAAGLPAFASDIPVFREIADGHAAFFDPWNAESMANVLEAFLSRGEYPALHAVQDFRWISWETSVSRLFDTVRSALPDP